MLLKLLFVVTVCRRVAASSELVDALAGLRGQNRVTLCMGAGAGAEAGEAGAEAEGAARCAGALWRPQWVVTQASCLDRRFMYKVLVLRDGLGVSCQTVEKSNEMGLAKKIRYRFVHPEYQRSARGDLALVGLSSRYWHLERLANTSSGNDLLYQVEPWLEEVIQTYPLDSNRIVSYEHKSYLFSTPMRMFITTFIVPFGSFVLFFLFVIFYTGPKDQIPYKSMEYEQFDEKDDRFDQHDKGDQGGNANKECQQEQCEDGLLKV